MKIDVVLFQDFIIVRSVELLFFKFQVLRKQSEAKEWIVTIESSALWERRTSTHFYTYLLYIYTCEYVCVRMCNTRGSIGCCLKSTTIRTSCKSITHQIDVRNSWRKLWINCSVSFDCQNYEKMIMISNFYSSIKQLPCSL